MTSSVPSEFTLNNLHNLALTKLSDTFDYGPLSGFDPAGPWIERAERARKERLDLMKKAEESWDFGDKENNSGFNSQEKLSKETSSSKSKRGKSPFKIGLNLVSCIVALGVLYGPPTMKTYHNNLEMSSSITSTVLLTLNQNHARGLKGGFIWDVDEYFPYTGW